MCRNELWIILEFSDVTVCKNGSKDGENVAQDDKSMENNCRIVFLIK